jgi:hypothetical protein
MKYLYLAYSRLRWPTNSNVPQEVYNQRGRNCTYKSNIEALSRNFLYRGKAMIIVSSDCVPVAIVIQNAKRVRSVVRVLSSVACLAVPNLMGAILMCLGTIKIT